MNLTNFLKQTDALTSQYSTEQFIAFIHDIGRVFPEHRREVFLEMLQSVGNKAGKASNRNEAKDSDFNKMYSHIRNNLKSIDSQEVTITGIWNETYDDWYDDSGEEFYYEDNSGISDMLGEACDFVHVCMDTERYKEGFAVGSQMLAMEILCDNEYGGEELSLGDMVYHGLLNCDLKQVILDTVYCAYRAVKRIPALLEKRTEGIMDANRRNYYGECAAYIAALGEVRESRGEMGAKQGLMTSYKDKYPQRRAFREEMRNYGWIDTKRKA